MGTGVIGPSREDKARTQAKGRPLEGEGNRYHKPLAFGSPCFLVIHGLPTIIPAFPQRGRGSRRRVDGCGTL